MVNALVLYEYFLIFITPIINTFDNINSQEDSISIEFLSVKKIKFFFLKNIKMKFYLWIFSVNQKFSNKYHEGKKKIRFLSKTNLKF